MSKRGEAWLEELYKAQYVNVFKLVRYLLKRYPVEDSHDIVQQVFLLAAEKDISDHVKPEGWLFITARNLCKNHKKAHIRQAQKAASLQALHLTTQSAEALDSAVPDETNAVDTMLTLRSTLPAEDYELIEEYCIKGTSLHDLSVKTGLSENCIRVRIHRIRERLRAVLLVCIVAFMIHMAIK